MKKIIVCTGIVSAGISEIASVLCRLINEQKSDLILASTVDKGDDLNPVPNMILNHNQEEYPYLTITDIDFSVDDAIYVEKQPSKFISKPRNNFKKR